MGWREGFYKISQGKKEEIAHAHQPPAYPNAPTLAQPTYLDSAYAPTYLTPYAPTYTPTLHNYPYKPTQSYTLIHTNPTNAPTRYIPTLHLHTYPKFLQPLHQTLHVCPTPTHLRYEHAIGRWGCVLPVIGYYVLRHFFARSLHLNSIWLDSFP